MYDDGQPMTRSVESHWIYSSDDRVRYSVAKSRYQDKDYTTLKTMINDKYDGVRLWVAMGLYDNKDYDTLKTMIDDSYDGVRTYVGKGLVDAEDWNTLEKFLNKEKNVWVKNDIEKYTRDKILEKHFGRSI